MVDLASVTSEQRHTGPAMASEPAVTLSEHIVEVISDSGEGAQKCGQSFAAIAARKPFACVPCCVYSRDFGRRRLPGADPGVQVRSYEQLVAHLRSLHPGVRVLDLDFEGKNKLLYWRPDNDSDPGLGDC